MGGLGEDLVGHKRLVEELKQELQGYVGVARTLEEDLAGHRETTQNLREELERERGHFQEGMAAVTQDLEGHRSVVKDLEALRLAELAELEKVRAALMQRESTIQQVHGQTEPGPWCR